MYIVPSITDEGKCNVSSRYIVKNYILLKYCESSIKPPKGLFLSVRFEGEGAG